MKTTNELYVSKALEEVWVLKEKAYEATIGKNDAELKLHYEKSIAECAKLLGAKIIKTESGAMKFA